MTADRVSQAVTGDVALVGEQLKLPLARVTRTTDPPTYHFEFERDGDENAVVAIRSEKLLNQAAFRAAVFAGAGLVPRKIGGRERPGWDHYVQVFAMCAEEPAT